MFKKTELKRLVANKTFIVQMDEELINNYITITFFDNDGKYVKPSTGTVTFEASDDGYTWGTIPNGELDFSSSVVSSRPNFSAPVTKLKMVIKDVNASKFALTVRSFGV